MRAVVVAGVVLIYGVSIVVVFTVCLIHYRSERHILQRRSMLRIVK